MVVPRYLSAREIIYITRYRSFGTEQQVCCLNTEYTVGKPSKLCHRNTSITAHCYDSWSFVYFSACAWQLPLSSPLPWCVQSACVSVCVCVMSCRQCSKSCRLIGKQEALNLIWCRPSAPLPTPSSPCLSHSQQWSILTVAVRNLIVCAKPLLCELSSFSAFRLCASKLWCIRSSGGRQHTLIGDFCFCLDLIVNFFRKEIKLFCGMHCPHMTKGLRTIYFTLCSNPPKLNIFDT